MPSFKRGMALGVVLVGDVTKTKTGLVSGQTMKIKGLLNKRSLNKKKQKKNLLKNV